MNEQPAPLPDDSWLDQVWQAGSPPDPTEAAWDGVLGRIKDNLPLPVRPPRRFAISPALWASGLVATAAAVLFVLVYSGLWPHDLGPQPIAPSVSPLAVAGDDDVEILSMDAADSKALVVGRLPHRGPLVLASAGEVAIDDTGHDVEVRVPRESLGGHAASPMIIMPLDSGLGRE